MKKLLALSISLVLCMVIVISVFASYDSRNGESVCPKCGAECESGCVVYPDVSLVSSDISVENYVNPFTESAYTENSFYGNGTILIILSHWASIEWREYTEADFPELELESVDTQSPMSTDMEFIKGNSEYRNIVHITLKDKSNEAVIEAIELLYERCEGNYLSKYTAGDIYMVVPMSKTYYDEVSTKINIIQPVWGDVNNDRKANLTDASLVLKYIAKWELPQFNADDADMDNNGRINLNDVVAILRKIAGWEAR